MEYLTQNSNNLTLAACLENNTTSLVPSDAPVPISEMLVSPAAASPAVSEATLKLTERSEKGSESRRKRKHASSTSAGGTVGFEGSRKSSRTAAKKVKEAELFSPSDQGVHMSYTPASSSSPGDSLSDRKVPNSSVDNVYEFTEQEEGHRPGDDVLLKRKRNSRNYGKPKNRWLLETELKNINESRRRMNDPMTGLEVDAPDSPAEDGEEDEDEVEDDMRDATCEGRSAPTVGPSPGLKLRICRSAKSGAYECHVVDRQPKLTSNSPQQFRTARGDCFRIGDVVWAKLVGWPWWPAQLQAFCADSAGQAKVKWFNWDQISFVHCDKLHHFVAAFNSKVDKRRKAGGYKLAIEQAWKQAKERRYEEADTYDSADDESSSSDEDDRPRAQPRAKSPKIALAQRHPVTAAHISLSTQPTPTFPMSPLEPIPAASTLEARKPAFSTPTTSAPSLPPNQAFSNFDLFDSASVGVDGAFDAFAEEAAVQSTDIVNLGPLPDIGPNLNLINSSNMYSFIPSFSDDDEMDTRPVLDPASIDSIMT